MITCKLTDEKPTMIVLDVEWLSLLLFCLLYPPAEIVLDASEGILSQRLLFQRWMQDRPTQGRLLPDEETCLAFLHCLSELHVSREEHSERFPGEDAVVVVPHTMADELPPTMSQAVEGCRKFPHGGWRAPPLPHRGESSHR